MAQTNPSATTSLLLRELLALVVRRVGDVGAAKKFLLDYFDRPDKIDWQFSVEFEVVPTGGSKPPPYIDVRAIELGFWRRTEDSQVDIDWEANSAVYVGPLMWVDFDQGDLYADDRYRVIYDLHYQVTLRVSLIRADPAPIIEWLEFLGLRLPDEPAPSPLAAQEEMQATTPSSPPSAPTSPTTAPQPALEWMRATRRTRPRRMRPTREAYRDWARAVLALMEAAFEAKQVDRIWSLPTMERRLREP